MKTLFITGAEGFTGKHLSDFARRRGYDVVGGVRNRARKLAFEKQYGKAIVCDVSDAINVARAIASVRPDALVHLAGPSRPQIAADEPLMAYQSIDSAWANILDGVRRAVPRARVLLASACDVYGNSGSNGQPLSESTPTQPVNTYGALKATAESIARTFFENYHLNITIVRPFHYTGMWQSEESFFGGLARTFATWDSTTRGNTLQLPELAFRRDILHVHDVVDAYLTLLEDGKPNETYNISSGKSTTIRDLVQTMSRAAGLNLDFEELPSPPEGRIDALCGDNSKLTSQTQWKPTRTAESALADLVQSYRSQRKEIAA